jgi:SAM-dependent methyltransferase
LATRLSHTKQLNQPDDVYGAQTVEDIGRSYASWASDYDASMLQAGYRHPMICVGLLTRHLTTNARSLLDAGQGTGLVGEWLKILGYKEVCGFDVSQGMLDRAAPRRVRRPAESGTRGDAGLPRQPICGLRLRGRVHDRPRQPARSERPAPGGASRRPHRHHG